jgi:hypothetical protein
MFVNPQKAITNLARDCFRKSQWRARRSLRRLFGTLAIFESFVGCAPNILKSLTLLHQAL